jgi:hypothetical protein
MYPVKVKFIYYIVSQQPKASYRQSLENEKYFNTEDVKKYKQRRRGSTRRTLY